MPASTRKLKLAICFLPIAGLLLLAASSVDVDITWRPAGLYAPINFAASYVNPTLVNLTWEKTGTTENVLIMAKIGTASENITDGYQVYFGPAENAMDTGANFDLLLDEVVYTAWGELDGGFSAGYASTNSGSGIMTTLTLVLLFGLLTGIGYWREDPIIYILAGMTWLIFGSYYTATTSYVGLALVVFGVYTTYRGIVLRKG